MVGVPTSLYLWDICHLYCSLPPADLVTRFQQSIMTDSALFLGIAFHIMAHLLLAKRMGRVENSIWTPHTLEAIPGVAVPCQNRHPQAGATTVPLVRQPLPPTLTLQGPYRPRGYGLRGCEHCSLIGGRSALQKRGGVGAATSSTVLVDLFCVHQWCLTNGGTIRHSYMQADQLAVTRVALPRAAQVVLPLKHCSACIA